MDFNIVSKRPFHVLRASDFDREFFDVLFELTDTVRRFEKTKEGLRYLNNLMSHVRAMLYFTQPSTRTFLSFLSALHILGIKPCEIRDSSTSSERKGESVEDSLQTFSSYVDLIIMRSPIRGLSEATAMKLDETDRPVPIINAGSGPDEHPTQALLDLYTLFRSFKKRGGIAGKTIALVGDLKRGRTIRSLARVLMHFENLKLILISPENLKIESDLRLALQGSKNLSFEETTLFQERLGEVDALYMTRSQDEYEIEGGTNPSEYEKYFLKFEHLKLMKKDSIIMHPMPRRKELDPKIDYDERAKYWRQERNGMWVRVALIIMIFGMEKHVVLPPL